MTGVLTQRSQGVGERLVFDPGNLSNCMQGQAWVGILAKAFGNLSRQNVGGISFHDDSLQWDLFQSFMGLPGRRVSQDGREAHRHIWKVFQQGLNDQIAANEAMPMDLVV